MSHRDRAVVEAAVKWLISVDGTDDARRLAVHELATVTSIFVANENQKREGTHA